MRPSFTWDSSTSVVESERTDLPFIADEQPGELADSQIGLPPPPVSRRAPSGPPRGRRWKPPPCAYAEFAKGGADAGLHPALDHVRPRPGLGVGEPPHSPPAQRAAIHRQSPASGSVLVAFHVAALVALEGLGQGLGDTSRFLPDGWLEGRPRQRVGKKAPGRRVHDHDDQSARSPRACLSVRHRSVQPHPAASLRSPRRSPPSYWLPVASPDLWSARPARPGPPSMRRHLRLPRSSVPCRARDGTRGRRPRAPAIASSSSSVPGSQWRTVVTPSADQGRVPWRTAGGRPPAASRCPGGWSRKAPPPSPGSGSDRRVPPRRLAGSI